LVLQLVFGLLLRGKVKEDTICSCQVWKNKTLARRDLN
jgi:hypothetical protein